MQMHLRQLAVMIVIIGFALAQFSFDASAKIVRMERISATSYGNFKSGEFVRWDVRLFGELSPSAEPVPDLDKAARNSRGMVEYATRATLIMPVEASRGNGALLLDVPNRGRPISLSLFNSPRNAVVPFGSFDQGTGFLQDAGTRLPLFRGSSVTASSSRLSKMPKERLVTLRVQHSRLYAT